MKPLPGAIEETKKHPNGIVYHINGDYSLNESVPPDRIMGAWKVDEEGAIVGDFIPNPNYKPKQAEK